ncbi:MAG: glutamine hydrolyzing CTP synthase [Candidatus Aenigmatarchaeota archaeon]
MRGTKWVFISGGVLSGLGKGLVSASVGRFMQSRGYEVVPIKCDGYLNVDPGTMNPIEHGEVFVLNDGGEVDMDFGHYERFLGIETKFDWNLTSGKIFQSVIEKERDGEYLGKTVQMIPHVTDEIKGRLKSAAEEEDADVVLVEIGGTVGDMENMIFLEAARQMQLELPEEDTCLVHVTLVPWLEAVGEQKTKPTQHSIKELESMGLEANVIVGRAEDSLEDKTKDKISLFCNVPKKHVVSNPDVEEVYRIPLNLKEDDLDDVVSDELELRSEEVHMERWRELVENLEDPEEEVEIAICGKYTKLEDSYVSIKEALNHCSAHLKTEMSYNFIETTEIENGEKTVKEVLEGSDGVIIPGGFGRRGAEGKIKVAEYCRKNGVPILGLCYGLQLMVTEFARNKCNLEGANSTEVDEDTENPVIDLIPEQKNVEAKGGTMRLGGQVTEIKKGSMAEDIYGKNKIEERFRHRYEVNPKYHDCLKENGLKLTGVAEKENHIVQIVELEEHPFYFATQFHPEFTSQFEEPNPVFMEFVKSCKGR